MSSLNSIPITFSLAKTRKSRKRFEEWVALVMPQVETYAWVAVAYHRLPRDLHDEIVNESFVKLLTTGTQPVTSFSSWLFGEVRTAGNKVAKSYGRRVRSDDDSLIQNVSLDDVDESQLAVQPNTAQVEANDLMERLSADDRKILQLRHKDELTLEEIATTLGISRATAGRLLAVAVANARKLAGEAA